MNIEHPTSKIEHRSCRGRRDYREAAKVAKERGGEALNHEFEMEEVSDQ